MSLCICIQSDEDLALISTICDARKQSQNRDCVAGSSGLPVTSAGRGRHGRLRWASWDPRGVEVLISVI